MPTPKNIAKQNPEQELNQAATKPEQAADQAREVAPETKREVTSIEVAGKVRAGASEAMHVVHQRNQAYEGAIITAAGRIPTQVADAVQQPIETRLKPAAQQMEHVLHIVEQPGVQAGEQEVASNVEMAEPLNAQSAQDRATNDLDVQRVVKFEPVAYELPSNPANLNTDAAAQIAEQELSEQQTPEQPEQQTVVDIKRPEDVDTSQGNSSQKGPTIKLAA